ncbi:hypothetical protein F11_15590 [Rhodospirillum rubrum F11]|uniref:Pepco domain-containing protein n=3 Tax=Rhodospirillum rubrum TaxID=1085 RepID=Q2RPV7_RHORT|nr:hypothetical protein [Rhodospirillum rubrum]ABC23838.1 hypothetical protein Rru_A3043 [Rhodospirillum rubrum ATCC 11170]AEO49580.1 hypothetical protein F11_15590 [Rhodospirillum rubrum F11]QXG79786.1 hypothetical protein KUL73_15700 [Rhodospirillum rubrum]
MPDPADDWTISVFIPDSVPPAHSPPDPSTDDHSLLECLSPAGRISRVSGRGLQQQWTDTIETLLTLGTTVSDRATDWQISEIDVGLTLSAKGELLFIAEAGAEASITFKLTRKTA